MSDKTAQPNTASSAAQTDEATLLPPVDVIEDVSGITLFADLPGVPKDRLALHVEGDTLTIEGDMVLPLPEGLASTHVEVGSPRYRRVFTLSKELDTEQVKANFEQGVLTLHIPKLAHAQARKIAVRVG